MIEDKVIRLRCYGIVVTLSPENEEGNRGGVITSENLHYRFDRMDYVKYECAIDGLEALILGHACAGVDIESPAYIEGIETAAKAIAKLIS
jgi:hypothetical protein